ncbi:MAG: hypothetical protein OER56_14610 [Hyphomicrobiales bacterium]|nr:hypothetical protein [Hyphomicrobiales bacterium]
MPLDRMITYEQARSLVLQHLAEMEAQTRQTHELRKDLSVRERDVLGLGPVGEALHLVIAEDETVEYDFGWLFFWGAVDDEGAAVLLVGNAPLICERQSGRIMPTGTAHSPDFYIKNYRDTGDPGRAAD